RRSADDKDALAVFCRLHRVLCRADYRRALYLVRVPRYDEVFPVLEGFAAGEVLHRPPADYDGGATGQLGKMPSVLWDDDGLRAFRAYAPVRIHCYDRVHLLSFPPGQTAMGIFSFSSVYS